MGFFNKFNVFVLAVLFFILVVSIEAAGPFTIGVGEQKCGIPTFAFSSTTDVIVRNLGDRQGRFELKAGGSTPEQDSLGPRQTLTFTRSFGGVLLCVINKGDTILVVTTR